MAEIGINSFALYHNSQYVRVENVFSDGKTFEVVFPNGDRGIASAKELATVSPGRLTNVKDILGQKLDEVEFFEELEKWLTEEALKQRTQDKSM